PYFMEEVRRYLEKKYGSDQVHEGGLRVYTSLDLDLQKTATQAVLDGLAAYERRRGWRSDLQNVVAAGETVSSYHHPDWDQPIAAGNYIHALVVDVGLQFAKIKIGNHTASLGPPELAWTKRKVAKNMLIAGDIIYVKV